MKHAGRETLDSLEDPLGELRSMPQLVERKTGTFYRRSKAFLHFHEDPAGPFVDVRFRAEGGFERLRVRTRSDQKALLRTVRTATRP
ncbi:MAG: hypothetical protein ACRDYB_01715 [Acidimicrobiales bacterium]